MKRISLLLLIFSTSIIAQTDYHRLIWNDDPSTTATIGWHESLLTSVLGETKIFYDVVDRGTAAADYVFTQVPDRERLAQGMRNIFAHLTGLQPNTMYYFVLHNETLGYTSPRFKFKTLPADKSRLSFIAGGDSRTDGTPDLIANRTARINANKMVAKLQPDAVFFGGDFTFSDTPFEWLFWMEDWKHTITDDGQLFGIVPARGNHEYLPSTVFDLFDVPNQEGYYALTFGDNLVRAYTLNTETSIAGDQTTWLENDLQTHTNVDWKMAQYHKPMRPHNAAKSEGNAQYDAWAQLFYDYNVALAVECDSHVVKTTDVLKPDPSGEEGFVVDQGSRGFYTSGTYYIGEGCWGAPTRANDDDKSWTLASGSFNQIKWIFVDQNSIEVRTVKTDNADDVIPAASQFDMPENIDLWDPQNGNVGEVLLIQRDLLGVDSVIASQLEVYPNPFTDSFRVSLPYTPEGTLKAALLDITGRVVQRKDVVLENNQFVIEAPKQWRGVVFFQLENEKGEVLAVRKLIKQ